MSNIYTVSTKLDKQKVTMNVCICAWGIDFK